MATKQWKWTLRTLFLSRTPLLLIHHQKRNLWLWDLNFLQNTCTVYQKERQVSYLTQRSQVSPTTCLTRTDSLIFTKQMSAFTVVCPILLVTSKMLTQVLCGWTQLQLGLIFSDLKTSWAIKRLLVALTVWAVKLSFSFFPALFLRRESKRAFQTFLGTSQCRLFTPLASTSASTNILLLVL